MQLNYLSCQKILLTWHKYNLDAPFTWQIFRAQLTLGIDYKKILNLYEQDYMY